MTKNRLLMIFVFSLIFGLVYYSYAPDISEKDMVYFENAKDSIIKNHEYFITHHIGQSINSSDKIVFTNQRENFATSENYFNILKQKEEKKYF